MAEENLDSLLVTIGEVNGVDFATLTRPSNENPGKMAVPADADAIARSLKQPWSCTVEWVEDPAVWKVAGSCSKEIRIEHVAQALLGRKLNDIARVAVLFPCEAVGLDSIPVELRDLHEPVR